MNQASYHHDLGRAFFLSAFAVDPALSDDDLRELVVSKDGTGRVDLTEQAKKTIFVERLNSLEDLEIEVSDKKYKVPEQLQKYRDAIGARNDAKGWFNGTVAIVEGAVQNPLRVFPGGFYDFVATKLDAVPHELVEEYPQGKNIEQLFKEWGVSNDARGKYLGISYLLSTCDGREISLVQRAKGMAIAPDCMSSPGSTPNAPFNKEGFNFKNYLRQHFSDEMSEEYKMNSDEFKIGDIFLFDDKTQVPFMAVEARTSLSTGDLAKRIYGDKGAIKEHPALFAFSPETIPTILDRFDVFSPTACVLNVYHKHGNYEIGF